ncbi:hypothetical protein GCM10011332_33480 [Terasakiella brassicae]|uniref:Apea-like HEPN domain-containing protein n=2 Tax=Terasakiella brassicae TaxID=1634917 RepID=A0A917C963_9PROT|nr:hypothetical protein GCM10011332_33480 [Terasakiella brassicae]
MELLDTRSRESDKAPHSNVKGKTLEAIKLFLSIEKNETKSFYLSYVLDELINALRNDNVAQVCLDTNYKYILEGLSDVENHSRLRSTLLQLDGILSNTYKDELFRSVRHLVEDGKSKRELYNVTKNLICELIGSGYSARFIKTELVKINKTTCATGGFDFDDFLAAFSGQHFTYFCYCGIPIAPAKYIEGNKNLKLETVSPNNKVIGCTKEELKLIKEDYYNILKLPVPGLDYYSAKENLDDFLSYITSAINFYDHSSNLSWSKSAYICREDEKRGKVIRGTKPLMTQTYDVPRETIHKLFDMKLADLFSPKRRSASSYAKISATLSGHANALQSPKPETQIVTLWSALETLLPLKGEMRTLEYYFKFMIPAIEMGHARKEFLTFFGKTKHNYREAFLDILHQEERGEGLLERFIKCVLLDSQKEKYDLILQMLSDNPYSKFRLERIKDKYKSLKTIRKKRAQEKQRLQWQITRIYRARNSITHAGESPFNTGVILTNLHEYYDRIHTNFDIYRTNYPKVGEIKDIFSLIISDYNNQSRKIDEYINNGAVLSEDNIFDILNIKDKTVFY